MAKLWHGYTDEQVLNIWDLQNWRYRLAQTLIEIAKGRGSAPETRLRAMKTLNSAIAQGLIDDDWRFPQMCASIMLDVADGKTRRWWHALLGRDRSQERLMAVLWFLETAAGFQKKDGESSDNVMVS